jgi:membrane protein YqaA with SNARE-associated domain
MNKAIRVISLVLGGLIGGYCGYWLGHWAGWSVDADWPFTIGGGTGAILTSMALSVLGVWLVAVVLRQSDRRATARTTSSR